MCVVTKEKKLDLMEEFDPRLSDCKCQATTNVVPLCNSEGKKSWRVTIARLLLRCGQRKQQTCTLAVVSIEQMRKSVATLKASLKSLAPELRRIERETRDQS